MGARRAWGCLTTLLAICTHDHLVPGSQVRVRYHPNRPMASLIRPLTLRRLREIAPRVLLLVAVVLGWTGVIWAMVD